MRRKSSTDVVNSLTRAELKKVLEMSSVRPRPRSGPKNPHVNYLSFVSFEEPHP